MKALKDAVQAIKAKRSTDGLDIIGARNSDGCSMVPDFNFRDCCVQHDMDYMNPAKPRLEADRGLYSCISSKTPWWSPLPTIYYLGVRAAGASRHVAFQAYNYDDDDNLFMG